MFAVEESIAIDAPPQAVWRLLADFSTHASWNPYFRLVGEPRVGRIEFEFPAKAFGDKFQRGPAFINMLAENRVLEWQYGIRPFSTVVQRFWLEPVGTGTLLTNRQTYRGLFSILRRAQLKRGAERIIRRINQSLKDAVDRPAPTRPKVALLPKRKRPAR